MPISLLPMLASLVDAPLQDPALVYEPKYDGIRAIADVPAKGRGVHVWSRLGNDKTNQFPDVAAALEQWARRRKEMVVLDGEIVALDTAGRPTGFQHLQHRIHLTDTTNGPSGRTALIVFDLLREGSRDWRARPWRERRAALERVFRTGLNETLRLSEVADGDGRALYQRALDSGWEGLIAKGADSRYFSGKRTPDWRKLKIVHEQEFVVCGWTEPRQTRSHFGALLLGVYDDGVLTYTGHTGTGFNERELTRLMKLLKPLETRRSPFAVEPKTNERAHWVAPKLVAQIKFTEWTADGNLRHPVYLGLRDDKKAEDVVREETSRLHAGSGRGLKPAGTRSVPSPKAKAKPAAASLEPSIVIDRLRAIEDGPGSGSIEWPGGYRLDVTNLRKVFWPEQKLTKGDLFRFYAQVSPFILPALADRPLVMKRYPNGVAAKPFYQHRAEKVPAGIRVEAIAGTEGRPQLIGGDLATLLYTVQLAAISQDPWFSRVGTLDSPDYVALDLDPADGVSFAQVLDVARWIHDELDHLGITGVPKTSGASGLHIYLPLPRKTPYDAGLLLCQIIATVVANKHPKQATVERAVKARGRRVYVDYMQNAMGKTLAAAYSARASTYAGVSTPLTWREVDQGVEREAFTIVTTPPRLREVGDLWAALRESKGIDIERVASYTGKPRARRGRGSERARG